MNENKRYKFKQILGDPHITFLINTFYILEIS